MNFFCWTFLSNVLNSHAIQGIISALHHVPLFMGGAWLLQVAVKTAVALQLLQTKYVVIQLAMIRSRRVSVLLNLTAVLPTQRCSVLERFFCFAKFLVGCGRVVSRAGLFGCGPGLGVSLSECFGPISCLHTIFLQTTDRQPSWLNLD